MIIMPTGSIPECRWLESANTSDMDFYQELVGELAADKSLHNVPLPNVPLPNVPLPNVPLPNVPVPDKLLDALQGVELRSSPVAEQSMIVTFVFGSGFGLVLFLCAHLFDSGIDYYTHCKSF